MTDRQRRMQCNGCTAILDTHEIQDVDALFVEIRAKGWEAVKGKLFCPECSPVDKEKKDA